MLNLGNLWIELWDGSDAVLWIVTSALVNGLLVFLLYHGRNSKGEDVAIFSMPCGVLSRPCSETEWMTSSDSPYSRSRFEGFEPDTGTASAGVDIRV